MLSRLLRLNHERYEEEVKAGLHDKKKPSPQPSPKRRGSNRPASTKGKAQPSFLMEAELIPEPEIVAPEDQPSATPTDQIGSWDQCQCLSCGNHLVGFSIADHTKTVHQDKDPGYRKINR